MRRGAIILCGGESRRMGFSKAALPFGGETMLSRVARRLGEVVETVVVVAAPGQVLPELPEGVILARDAREGRGPLEGLAAGLRTLRGRAEVAYIAGCDAPRLAPAFVARMFELLEDRDLAVPRDDEHHHPLAAVYRVDLLPKIETLLAADRLRPFFLFELADAREVPVELLRDADPELATLDNLNRPEDYFAALAREGLEAPPEVRAALA
jgi:molybdopterin-guanine dinucleotide biosynthesis protein A